MAVTASGEYSISASPAGFTVKDTDDGISITAEANTTGKTKTGIITLTLDADKSKKVDITVTQNIPEE